MTPLPANYIYCECGHTPCDGVDCGVYLPGQAPRKKAVPKTAKQNAAIRAQAWATRRAKYGPRGHRGYAPTRTHADIIARLDEAIEKQEAPNA